MLHLSYGGVADGQPVNVYWVWGQGGTVTGPGCVQVVDLVSTHADVESAVRPGQVDLLARRAHVGEIRLLVLHHLHDADLPWRVVLVKHWFFITTADIAPP